MRVRNGDVRRSALVAIVALVVAGARPSAQFEKTISSTFDGWTHLADGSYELVFGYMNRNATEIDVPLGAANQMDPAPADQGQPTSFLPGRQRAAFRIHVPADFKGKYVWTLTYAGVTQTATASIDQNYSLDVGDPEPPTVKVSARRHRARQRPGEAHAVVGAAPRPPVPQQRRRRARDARAARRLPCGGASFAGRGRLPLETVRKPDRRGPDRRGIANNRSARFA